MVLETCIIEPVYWRRTQLTRVTGCMRCTSDELKNNWIKLFKLPFDYTSVHKSRHQQHSHLNNKYGEA